MSSSPFFKTHSRPGATLIEVQMQAWDQNIHPLPIAEAWDGRAWTVDLQYRDSTGYDIEASFTHVNLDIARTKAYHRLRKQID